MVANVPMMDALSSLFAAARAGDMFRLDELAKRQAKLCARLAKFNQRHVVEILAGLLTQPENHAATLRIEAVIHLAVLHCKGSAKPTLLQIREWVNEILLADGIGAGEDPVEDVFSSVVPSSFGSATILEGAWPDNGYHLTRIMGALLPLREDAWAGEAMHSVMSLLRLGNAMAQKAGVARYTVADSQPGSPVKVAPRNVEAGVKAVTFNLQEIFGMGLIARDIAPFVGHTNDLANLASESLTNSSLERFPLLRHEDGWMVMLPTAIGAAARRLILDRAAAAGAFPKLQAELRRAELQDLRAILAGNMGLSGLAILPLPAEPKLMVVKTEFDLGGHALIVLVADELSEAMATGLQGMNDKDLDRGASAVSKLEKQLATSPDYRRGLTLIVHGGVGRGIAIGFDESPAEWHRVSIGLGDALRMSWDADFDAKRVWKILSQQERLHERGYEIHGVGDFVNLYGYLETQGFDPVQPEISKGALAMLATDYAAAVRHRIRSALDYHLVIDPTVSRFVEVQRRSTSSYFKEISNLPLYVAPLEALNGEFLAVVETPSRAWWVELLIVDGPYRAFSARIWDAAQRWLVRLAPRLEELLPGLPERPIHFRLEFPEIDQLTDEAMMDATPPERPQFELVNGVIAIRSGVASLRGYMDATNIAERQLLASMALAGSELAGTPQDAGWADSLATEVTRSADARFAHAIPARDATDIVRSYLDLPPPRFVCDENRGWAHLGLAFDAGAKAAGKVLSNDVGPLLRTAVEMVWERIKDRLEKLDRRSIVLRAMLNHEAIDRDRREWQQTAAALRALHHDQTDVLDASNTAELRRSAAGVASRALAEMAICTSPTMGGRSCTDIDLDDLIGEVAAMLDCAGQCDAHFYGLATSPLGVAPNGDFQFDRGFGEITLVPYMFAQGDIAFHEAADSYAMSFEIPAPGAPLPPAPVIDADLKIAVRAEFGMDLEHLVAISHGLAETAIDAGQACFCMRKSELLEFFRKMDGAVDAERAFAALTLVPRAEWGERNPKGALARDWQPWRMNRKLSLTRRPLIQIDEADDPEVLVASALVSKVIFRLFSLVDGRLGAEMFDTKEVDRWLGKIVNELGHAFNHSVATKLQEVGLNAEPDQLMTLFGGKKELGDVDVLAWDKNTGAVWAIECKRLLLDRTIGEIGERLLDYTTKGNRHKKRTPIQKHLDRVNFLRANRSAVAAITKIPVADIKLKAALVTDGIVPMQFTKTMSTLVDRTCTFRDLAKQFGSS
ncbi:hypothetical protein [Mesorhizobium sp. M0040]|uniref:hypothetical protein n=1 Tax=Mesorhizobium sp. M0040 TaxID=2956855 RepID=UPI00333D2570